MQIIYDHVPTKLVGNKPVKNAIIFSTYGKNSRTENGVISESPNIESYP